MGGDAGAVSSFGSAFGRQLGAPREVAFTIERGSDPGTYDVRYTLHQTGAARLTGTYHNGHQEVPLHVPRQFLTVVAGTWDIGRCKLVHAFDDGAPPPVIAAGFTWRARLLLRDAHNNPVPLAASVVVKAKWVLVKDPLDEVTPVSAVATIAPTPTKPKAPKTERRDVSRRFRRSLSWSFEISRSRVLSRRDLRCSRCWVHSGSPDSVPTLSRKLKCSCMLSANRRQRSWRSSAMPLAAASASRRAARP
jgi:hypothetical protein